MEPKAFTKQHTAIVKGIAVLMLLFHHLFNDYPEYEGYYINYWPFTGDQVTNIALTCRICVAAFVFITGFGLAASFNRQFPRDRELPGPTAMAKFSIKRWWGLMTRYWFVVVLAWVFGFLGRDAIAVYGPGIKATLVRGFIDFMGLAEACQSDRLNPTWWYMSLAILLIFLAPIAMRVSRKVDSVVLFVAFCLYIGCSKESATVILALPCFFFGIVCYEHRMFDRWAELWGDKPWGVAVKSLLVAVLFSGLSVSYINYNYNALLDVALPWLLCALVMTLVSAVPVLREVLGFFGKHSDNIFFTHTLLYSYYFLSFYYSFQIPIVILAVLAVTTLALSLVLEFVKSKSGYNRVMARVGEKLLLLV